jgi:Sortilin, neurotensin receptor 3,
MRFRRFLDAVTACRSLVMVSLLFGSAYAKADGPSISLKKFDHEPMNIEYFADSDVIMFQDFQTNIVYRSEDAGASWDEVKDLPEGKAWSMYMHQFDAKRAYVLTPEGTHYKTSDRGKTWEKFYVGAVGTVFPGRLPLSFNAGDPDRIIFNGMDCEGLKFCIERVSCP